MAQWTHLLVAQVQELVELDAAVGEGTEGPPLLEVGGDLGVSDISLDRKVSTSACGAAGLPDHVVDVLGGLEDGGGWVRELGMSVEKAGSGLGILGQSYVILYSFAGSVDTDDADLVIFSQKLADDRIHKSSTD